MNIQTSLRCVADDAEALPPQRFDAATPSAPRRHCFRGDIFTFMLLSPHDFTMLTIDTGAAFTIFLLMPCFRHA